jgi:hypothetical protein
MPWVGFEPTIATSEGAKTVRVHALDRSVAVTGIMIFRVMPTSRWLSMLRSITQNGGNHIQSYTVSIQNFTIQNIFYSRNHEILLKIVLLPKILRDYLVTVVVKEVWHWSNLQWRDLHTELHKVNQLNTCYNSNTHTPHNANFFSRSILTVRQVWLEAVSFMQE